MSFRISSMSVEMSFLYTKAVPSVGGKSPVSIDLQQKMNTLKFLLNHKKHLKKKNNNR